MARPIPINSPRVVVDDDVLYVDGYIETDPIVVAVIGGADNLLEATRQCVQIGAHAVRVANVAVDSDLIEKRFDSMTTAISAGVEESVAKIAEITSSLLDGDEGTLTLSLANHRSELERQLGSTFDPQSKQSVIGIFEQVLIEAYEKQSDAVRKLMSSDGEDSPLANAKRELLRALTEAVGELRRDVQSLAEKVAVNDAVAPVFDMTSAKGFQFEDVLHARIGAIASVHGDVAEQVGTVKGVAGRRRATSS